MTAVQLKAIRDRMPGRNAEEKTAALAAILGCSVRTVRNKMSGETKITKIEEAFLKTLSQSRLLEGSGQAGEADLLACPFCEQVPKLETWDNGYCLGHKVACQICGHEHSFHCEVTKAEAAAAWNGMSRLMRQRINFCSPTPNKDV